MYSISYALFVSSSLALAMSIHLSATAQEPPRLKTADAKIRDLQQERVDLLQRAFPVSVNQYRSRSSDINAVLTTQLDLLGAQLAMVDTREDQVRVLESNLSNAKEFSQVVQTNFRARATSELDALQAEAAALRIEIKLLKLGHGKVRKLQQQRLKTVERAFQVALNQYGYGRANCETLLMAQLDLLDAQLDTTTTREDQISVLESNLKSAKNVLQAAKTRSRSGFTTNLDVQRAEAAGLRIEITLSKLRDADVPDVQRQRLRTLERAVGVAATQYASGIVDSKTVFAAQYDLLNAQIDLVETREDQMRMLESRLEMANGALRIAEARFRGGVTSELDVLQARSGALRIEIELLTLQRMDHNKDPS